MTRRCSHCANDGHNSRTCPSRGGVFKLYGVRLTDGGSIIKKSASMGNVSAYYDSSSPAAASSNPSSPSFDLIHDPLYLPDGYVSDDPAHATSSSNRRSQRKKEKNKPIHDLVYLPDGYLSDDPAHATSSSNRRAQRKKEGPHPSGAVSVQPLQVAIPPLGTTERMTRSRLRTVQEAEASIAEARASPTRKRLRKGLLVSGRGTSLVPPSGPEGPSTAIGLSSDLDDNDNLSIPLRVTRLRIRRLVLPDAEEEPSAEVEPVAKAEPMIEAETMAEAEPIAEAEDVEEGHDIPHIESGQVPPAAKVTEGGMIVEGVKAPNPVDPIHSDHSTVGGEDFVRETPREEHGAREPLEVEPLPMEARFGNSSQSTKSPLVQQAIISSIPVAEGGEDVMTTSNVGPLNLVQFAEVDANLATLGATAAAGTSGTVASATSEQLADLYPTHFPEVPTNLGISRDFYTGMDTTIIPDLNVGDCSMDDLFSEQQGDAGSFHLCWEISSPGHLPASTHSNTAGQSSSGEVRRPQNFGHSTSLPQ